MFRHTFIIILSQIFLLPSGFAQTEMAQAKLHQLPKTYLKSTVIGAASSAVGGTIGGQLNSVVSTQLSRVVGSQATKIVSNIATSTIVGGGFGAGFSLFSGGNPWQGFVGGMRTGLISGSISTLVPAAINKWGQPKAPEPELSRKVENLEIIKTEQLLLKAPQEMKLLPAPRNPLWDGPHGGVYGSGQKIQKLIIDSHYPDFKNLPLAKGIDGRGKYTYNEGRVVQIKTMGYYGRTAGKLTTTKIVEFFSTTNEVYTSKILHIIIPPNYTITNLNQVRINMAAVGVKVEVSILR